MKKATLILLSGCNNKAENEDLDTNSEIIKDDIAKSMDTNTIETNKKEIQMRPYVKENVKNNIYTNPDYKWTFEIPEEWKGKYTIIDAGSVYFYYVPQFEDYTGPEQNFFRITVITKEKYYEEKDRSYSWVNYFIGEDEKYVLEIRFPLENKISNQSALEEFNSLNLSTNEILSRLSFPNYIEEIDNNPFEYTEKNVKNFVYINPEYGWTFNIPEKWEEKYIIRRISNDVVEFSHYVPDFNGETLFWVQVMPMEVYNSTKNSTEPENPYIDYIGENEEYVLIISFPFDFTYQDENLIKEYASIYISREEILERLSFPSQN